MSCRSCLLLPTLVVLFATLSGCGAGDADDAKGVTGTPDATRPTEETVPLSFETIFREGSGAGRAVLSPDGARVAVVARGEAGSGIYLLPVEPEVAGGGVATEAGTRSRLLVAGGDGPVWSPNGEWIAYLAEGELRVVEVGAGEGGLEASNSPLTVASGLAGIRNPAFSPDGERLAFYSTQTGAQDLWLASADGSGAPAPLTEDAAEADDVRFTPSWSPDGRYLAYVSNRADWWHDDVWLVEAATGRTHRVSSRLMASSSPVWSPDGTSLVLMGTAKDEYWYEDLAYLYRIDLEPGSLRAGEPRAVAEAPIEMQVWATDYIMRFDPYWSADGERIHFPYHERGAFDLWAVPSAGGVATRVTNVGGAWTSLDATPDGSRAVFVRDAPTEGQEAWVVDMDGGLPRRVTDFTPRFADLQVPLEVSYRSFDGLYIQGFLFLPPAIREALPEEATAHYEGPICPALVQVHGGGTNSYYQGSNLVEQVLAAKGFVVLAINYRGGSGFGREFQDLAVEDWLADQSKDPGAAAGWLREQPWVSDRVGIYGGSYGGMQTMSAITRTPDQFDAAVPMRGIYSEASTLPHADRLGKIFTITGHGGMPEERPEIYEKSETLARFDRIKAPVLIMHGERDVRAPFENFELAVERLRELGKEFEAKSYPEGHSFRDPANLIDMYSRLEAFFVEHLGSCRSPGGG